MTMKGRPEIQAAGGIDYKYDLPEPDWEASELTTTDLAEILIEVDEMGRSRNPKKSLLRELHGLHNETDMYCIMTAIDGTDLPHPGLPLDVEQNAIYDALGEVYGDGTRESGEAFENRGGDVTAGLRQSSSGGDEAVSLGEVFGEWLYELAEANGPNAQADLLEDYVSRLRNPWVLTHIINNDMTLYFGTYMMLRGLEDTFSGDVFRQYRTCGAVNLWYLQASRGTATDEIAPHDYHATMKAESTDATEVSEELNQDAWVAQTKYDGARMFIHHDGDGDVRAYIGGGKDVTAAIPELDEMDWPDAPFIFDCEATPYQDGEVVPFENIMTRLTRKPGEEFDADDFDTDVVFKVFDCLYWKGRDITRRMYDDRLTIVRAVFPPDNVARTGEDLETTFHKSLEAGHEGLVLKRKDGEHSIGGRKDQWLKWKPEPETLDVRVIGCERGGGRLDDRMGALEVGLIGPDDEIVSVGSVGTGFSDDERAEFWSDYETDELVGEIIEVEFEEFQPNSDGWGLRFPSFQRRRPDGSVDTVERAARLQDRQDQYEEWLESRESEGLGDLFG